MLTETYLQPADCVSALYAIYQSNMVTARGYPALTADGFAVVKRMLDRPDQP